MSAALARDRLQGVPPGGEGRLRRLTVAVAWALGAVALSGITGALTLAVLAHRLGPPPIEAARPQSVVVLDRSDRLLRAFTTADGRWRLPVEVGEVDPRYLAMLKAFEDRRFEHHPGVDVLALARAAGQLASRGRIVSGGSTLTMQVARLLEGEHDRSFGGKTVQIVRALQLERRLSKADILRLYLKLAPFGGNIEGVRAATLAYFGKEPRRLSIGEAALLVALPQSPETRRPDRHPEAARRARDRVLDRAVAAGIVTAAEAARAKAERVPTVRRTFPQFAAHLAEAEVARHDSRPVHRLTLDRDLQSSLETLTRDHVRALGQGLSASVLVADHRTGEVLAHVGSPGHLDHERLGAIDMVAAVRSPGSTLKPFIYGLGFEAGLIHPETLIEDRPARFGTYAPKNFDDDFHGTISIRHALAQSLNVPAVKVLNAVGPGRLVNRLKRAGADPQLPGRVGEPTLAVGLGGIGLTLRDLAGLYAALARGGEPIRLVHDRGEARAEQTLRRPRIARQLLSRVAAWYVTDILKDAPPPAHARGGRLAYKTGTSYGYRDAWAIGYDGAHVVAVWTGRADGGSQPGLSGRTAAAPLLFDAFQRLGEVRAPLAAAPAGAVKSNGADLPPPLKRFTEGSEGQPEGQFHEPAVTIAFPPDRADLETADTEAPLVLKAENGALPLTWLADGEPIPSEPHRREVEWQPAGAGFVRLTVIDARGRADRVVVRVR